MDAWTDTIYLLKQYGPLLVVTAFVLWQGWVREKRLNDRITKLEDEQRNVLLPMVARDAEVIALNNMLLTRLEECLKHRVECPYLRSHDATN